jgi:hypothetical protein
MEKGQDRIYGHINNAEGKISKHRVKEIKTPQNVAQG